jgi:glycosyltransferase involved in cell wall biosynthesis
MFVSAITVTYNRSRFIPALLKCYDSQLYKQTEWIILDDSDPEEQRKTEALFQEFSKTHPNIRYSGNPWVQNSTRQQPCVKVS